MTTTTTTSPSKPRPFDAIMGGPYQTFLWLRAVSLYLEEVLGDEPEASALDAARLLQSMAQLYLAKWYETRDPSARCEVCGGGGGWIAASGSETTCPACSS